MPVGDLVKHVGEEIGASSWTLLDQARINEFAHCTGDHQWIHVDAERAARESPFGGTIAHGFLTLSMLSRLSHDCFEIRGDFKMRINYGLNRVRFPAPVPAGSRIRPRFTLQSLDEFDEGYQAVWVVSIEVEGGRKPALYAEWVVRLYA